MADLKGYFFIETHEWVKKENDLYLIGISDFAQNELGDIVFAETKNSGESIENAEVFGHLESVKAVSDLYAPISGEIVEFNQKLIDTPELINKDPYLEGWIIKVRSADVELSSMMDNEAYTKFIAAL